MKLRLPSKAKKPNLTKALWGGNKKSSKPKKQNGTDEYALAWKQFAVAEKDKARAQHELDTASESVSEELHEIYERFGKGPHEYNGGRYTIVSRGGSYFLRAVK